MKFRVISRAALTTWAALVPLSPGFGAGPEKQLQTALPSLERAWARQPGVYENGWNLALAYHRLGRSAEARDVLHQLLQAKPTAEVHNLVAAVLEKTGEYVESAREFEAAARLEPSEKHLGEWAGFLVRRAALSEAITIYTYALKLYPKSQPLHIGLGLAHHGRGDYDDAVRWICAAVDLDPADPRPITFLGKLVDTSEKMAPDLTRRLANFARLYPGNAEARLYYALSLWKESEKGAAPFNGPLIEEHLRAAAELDPKSFESQLQLGILYDRLGRYVDAVPAFRRAVALRPDSDGARYRLARVYQKTGQAQLAAREFEAVKRLRDASTVRP